MTTESLTSMRRLMPQLDVEEMSQRPVRSDNILWMNVLRSSSAYQMYRLHVQERVNGADVAKFLLQNEQFRLCGPQSDHADQGVLSCQTAVRSPGKSIKPAPGEKC